MYNYSSVNRRSSDELKMFHNFKRPFHYHLRGIHSRLWGALPFDRTCLFLTPFLPLRRRSQNFRKFAIEQKTLLPVDSAPVRIPFATAELATSAQSRKGEEQKCLCIFSGHWPYSRFFVFCGSVWIAVVSLAFLFLQLLGCAALRCVNCMRTKIDEYASRHAGRGEGGSFWRGGGYASGRGMQEQEEKTATKCECAKNTETIAQKEHGDHFWGSKEYHH